MNLPARGPPPSAAADARPPRQRAYRPPTAAVTAPRPLAPKPLPTPTPTPTRTHSVPPPPSQQQVHQPQPVPHHGMLQPQQQTYNPAEVEYRHSQLLAAASPPPFPDSQSQRNDSYPASQSQYSPRYYPMQNQNGGGADWPRVTDSYRPVGFPPNYCEGGAGGGAGGSRMNHTPISNPAPTHLMRNDSGVLVQATQSTTATSSANANAYRPTPSQQQTKVPVSEKVMAAVGQLEARVQQLSEDVRGFRDGLHDVRVGLQALPTKEEAKDDLRDLLSPTLHDFFANLTASVQHMLSPIPELTAQLTAEKARDMVVVRNATPALPPAQVPHSDPAAATAGLVEHLVASLRPVDELRNAIHDMKDLPEALQAIGVFHRSIELLHHKLDKAQECPQPPPPPPEDTRAAQLAQMTETFVLIESRLRIMEERLGKHFDDSDGTGAAAAAAEERSRAMGAAVEGIAKDVAAFRTSSFLTDRLQQRLPQLADAVATMREEAERVQAERAAAERVERERAAAEEAQAEQVEAERLRVERLAAERVEVERSGAQQHTFASTPHASDGRRKRAAPTNHRRAERPLELQAHLSHPRRSSRSISPDTRSPSPPTTYTKPLSLFEPRSRSASTAATEPLPPADLLPTPQSRHGSLPPSSPEPELEDFTETLYVLQGAALVRPARPRQSARVEWQVHAPAFGGANAVPHRRQTAAAPTRKKSTTRSDDDIVILGFAPPPPNQSEDDDESEMEVEIEPAAAALEETLPQSSTPVPEVLEREPELEPEPVAPPAPPKPARNKKRKAPAKPAPPRKAGRSHKWTGAREPIFTADQSESLLADIVQVKTEPGVHLTRSTRRLLGVPPDAPSYARL